MVKTRRAHRKSRGGCRECKRRRIKCSEGKPSCAHCTRHHVSCVYDIPGTPIQPASSKNSPAQSENLASRSSSPVRHTSKPPYIDLSRPQHLFDLKDMELLHHWNLVTSASMVDSLSAAEVWRIHFPRIAFQHPYVMHSLLSIAALHVAYLNPSRRQSSIIHAGCHHAKALEGFHEAINHIGADNGDAVFTTATLLFFHAFITLSQLRYDFDQQIEGCSRVSRILGAEWIPLLRGVGAVLLPALEHVRRGPLSPMMGLGNWEAVNPDDHPTADDEKLRGIGQLWKDDKNAEVYETSLHLLRKFWAWMVQLQNSGSNASGECGYHGIGSGPFMWLFITPEMFFDLQRQRQPAALVLFAHFGAFLQKLNGYWWAEGCGKTIVSAVDDCLGSYWEPWTRWPKEVVGLI
ncbi:hypothetical protein COCMIDRAFT_100395 [Bipolaris oryzae ATCC 44560]|uniref:Zn(2)-C6 fungal-type domain-containing protein n=1 Tax=Bipolaris oryzae ATCC 44560 TaxID=930090 RepID=W6Z7N0_COCMI|nr:uncharacterized protein COCMIDRAFT_100395 [Bipolaris oryzae ATCC 44560]EUC43589.1 hypothetical protein COCMIDRAFT_100395 [Bipolaris oryzae ATCC 44560]